MQAGAEEVDDEEQLVAFRKLICGDNVSKFDVLEDSKDRRGKIPIAAFALSPSPVYFATIILRMAVKSPAVML